jgi:MoaA/NifB/PqqE/SkfB family radical SAM enzyme
MLTQADYVSFCGMGELFLVPEVERILDYLNKHLPDKNKILTTNGLALNNKIWERITNSKYSLQVSLHASNASLHEYLTGIKKGGFEHIIQQIRILVEKRKNKQSPYITFIFVVNTMNIEDLPNFVELAASLGVDCVQCNYLTIFKPSHLKLSCFFKQEVTNQMFDIAKQKANELKVSLVLPPRFSASEYFRSICSDPWKNIYVDTEGAVLPCCYSGEHFGELEKENILSIWNNAKFKRIRTDLASGNPVEMCKYCLNNRQDNVNLFNAHISFRPEVQKAIFKQTQN